MAAQYPTYGTVTALRGYCEGGTLERMRPLGALIT